MALAATPITDVEKKVFDFISNNDLSGLKSHMEIHKLKPDLFDDHGMNPLTHACFKGNIEISQYLIDQGANVNSDCHENGYTALHFAALSGKADLCQLLLTAGARSDCVNSVGRTPAQMGAFVGNHQCVTVINNFLPQNEIVRLVNLVDKEEGQGVPRPGFATSVHKLAMQVNLHPVKIAIMCDQCKSLRDNLPYLSTVLSRLSSEFMKMGSNSNEIISFKLHYFSTVVAKIIEKKEASHKHGEWSMQDFIKIFLKNSSGNEFLEYVIRDAIRSYKFTHTTIFQQMIASFRAFKVPPPALGIIVTSINGQRAFNNEVKSCSTCGDETASKKCSKCKKVQYCDRECQRLHWFAHRKSCTGNTDDISVK